jgi:hypothetical protein
MTRHLLRVLAAIGVAVVWGSASGWLGAQFWVVALGGLAAATLGFWFERDALLTEETRARRDFPLILAAGYAFLVVVGVGVVSLSYLAGEWLHLAR